MAATALPPLQLEEDRVTFESAVAMLEEETVKRKQAKAVARKQEQSALSEALMIQQQYKMSEILGRGKV